MSIGKDFGIIVKKNPDDVDQYGCGAPKVVNPLTMSMDGYPVDSLAHLTLLKSPTQENIETRTVAPESGTPVLTAQESKGSPSIVHHVIGSTVNNSGKTTAGNNPLDGWPGYAQGVSSGKNIKPNLVDAVEKGAKVIKAVEKGEEWLSEFTRGLNFSATELPILGQLIEELKQIPTALQKDSQIPTENIISQLPGEIMNIGNMLKGMTEQEKSQATQNMDSTVKNALESLTRLMTDHTTDGKNVTGGRVHPEKFKENMIDLLSQATNHIDVQIALNRLRNDPSVRGLEEYSVRTFSGLTANTAVDANNELYLELSDHADKSKIYFTEGFKINVNSQTYTVSSANQDSRIVEVFPDPEEDLLFARVYVYAPVYEFTTNGPYGEMTMTVDMDGNIKPNKESQQAINSAVQSFAGIINSSQGGGSGQNFFGSVAGQFAGMIDRIPNNTHKALVEGIINKAKGKLDTILKKALDKPYPF